MKRAAEWIRRARSIVRALTGEDRYERYLAHLAAAHSGYPPPDRRRFYREMLDRKWSGISRCC